MATTEFKGTNTPPNFRLDPNKYESLGDIVAAASVAKPDVRDMLVKTYGDQGITGFLNLTGAVKNAGTSDEINWFEEGRRHTKFAHGASTATGASHVIALSATENTDLDPAILRPVQENDVIMDVATGRRLIVTDRDTAAGTFTATDLGGNSTNLSAGDFVIIGNMYAQGTDQPKWHTETEVQKYTNSYAIVKDVFKVNGSQATNIGYVNVGNGDYRWYIHGENETRQRFLDKREMTLLFGQKADTSGSVVDLGGGIVGTEGYFSALEKRGLVVSGAATSPLDSIAEFDNIIIELDKQGAPAEYAMYLNRKQSLAIDDMLASGIATSVTAGLPGQFGAFNNNADMAVQLGFKSFTRGGYTFHKHDWKLLNDPTLLGASSVYQGAMVPLSQVVDPRSGSRAPSLEMNYKAANGYSREMEHWITGGGVLGYNQNGVDAVEFNYRSEVALVVRAANQHVAIKG